MLLWAHCSDTAVVERGEPRLTQDRQRRETEREAKREAERESNRERDRKGERGERERAQGRARRVVDKAQGSAVTYIFCFRAPKTHFDPGKTLGRAHSQPLAS